MNLDFGPFLQPIPIAARAERGAVRVLDRCINELGLDTVPLPIPVEEWIEHPLGYEFGVEDLSGLGEGVLGASYIEEKRIVVDQSLTTHEGRLRFTVAHELGHMLLHQKQRRVFTDTAELHQGREAQLERQADRFAAAMLMPIQLVIREVFSISDNAGLDRTSAIALLLDDSVESEWLWRTKFLPAITRRFGVSRQAAMNRFQDVRFRENKTTFLPSEVAHRVSSFRADDRPSFRITRGCLVPSTPSQSTQSLF